MDKEKLTPKESKENPMAELAEEQSFDDHMRSYREARLAGTLPEGIRDPQDYEDFLAEKTAKQKESNTSVESVESKQASEKDEVRNLLNIACNRLGIDASDRNTKLMSSILISESYIQSESARRADRMEFTESVKEDYDKLEKELAEQNIFEKIWLNRKNKKRKEDSESFLKRCIYNEWNCFHEIVYRQREACNLVHELWRDKSLTEEEKKKGQQTLDEEHRRQVLALPEVKELSKKSKLYDGSYHEYSEPKETKKRSYSLLFEDYYMERLSSLEEKNKK